VLFDKTGGLNREDEIVAGTMVCKDGQMLPQN
jgi:hypothetical protein